MKKLLLIIILLGFGLIVFIPKENEITESQEQPISKAITRINTSEWTRSSIHQGISVLIPKGWTSGSDGIYNYDVKTVTGPRDPNFPNNSFKCVFYKDENLRNKLNITSEQVINTNPQIATIQAKWIGENEGLRQSGESVNLYTFKTTSQEVFIECNVFKGSMLDNDKVLLEHVILTTEIK